MDPDPHHFGNLDQHPDPHPHQIKIRIRIRIKVISWNRNPGTASICRWEAKTYGIWASLSTFSRVYAFIWKLESGFGSGSEYRWKVGSASASNKNQNPDPDPHKSDKSNPDPHQVDADPQQWNKVLLFSGHCWFQCFGSVFIWYGSGRIRILHFRTKTTIYLSLGLHKRFPGYRRSLQSSKENIQRFKTWNF